MLGKYYFFLLLIVFILVFTLPFDCFPEKIEKQQFEAYKKACIFLFDAMVAQPLDGRRGVHEVEFSGKKLIAYNTFKKESSIAAGISVSPLNKLYADDLLTYGNLLEILLQVNNNFEFLSRREALQRQLLPPLLKEFHTDVFVHAGDKEDYKIMLNKALPSIFNASMRHALDSVVLEYKDMCGPPVALNLQYSVSLYLVLDTCCDLSKGIMCTKIYYNPRSTALVVKGAFKSKSLEKSSTGITWNPFVDSSIKPVSGSISWIQLSIVQNSLALDDNQAFREKYVEYDDQEIEYLKHMLLFLTYKELDPEKNDQLQDVYMRQDIIEELVKVHLPKSNGYEKSAECT
jgi:hypothetical protein